MKERKKESDSAKGKLTRQQSILANPKQIAMHMISATEMVLERFEGRPACLHKLNCAGSWWTTQSQVDPELAVHVLSWMNWGFDCVEALPILCVRNARWERERESEREIQREIDGSHEAIVALKLAVSFALFLAINCTLVLLKSFALSLPTNITSVSPLLNGAEFTLSVSKNVALFETVRILCKIRTVKWRYKRSKQQNKWSNFRLHRLSSHRKNESN